jgi:hypothetical protein
MHGRRLGRAAWLWSLSLSIVLQYTSNTKSIVMSPSLPGAPQRRLWTVIYDLKCAWAEGRPRAGTPAKRLESPWPRMRTSG